jgi:hypothetical protein
MQKPGRAATGEKFLARSRMIYQKLADQAAQREADNPCRMPLLWQNSNGTLTGSTGYAQDFESGFIVSNHCDVVSHDTVPPETESNSCIVADRTTVSTRRVLRLHSLGVLVVTLRICPEE